VQVRVDPTRTGLKKLILSSALAEKTFRSLAHVREAAPMVESAKAVTNPPWSTPVGLAKRSSASMRHTVRPGSALSRQTIPSVRSELGGTWTLESVGVTDCEAIRVVGRPPGPAVSLGPLSRAGRVFWPGLPGRPWS